MASFGKDLEIEILSNLPVKSLLRFKCVSKSWYFLIKSPYFISKHLQYSRETFKKDGNIPLFFTKKTDITSKASWIASDNFAAALDPASLSFFRGMRPFKKILGPVNGLYVIVLPYTDDMDFVFLCNPALREVKDLPLIPLLTSKVYGFGYDSINKDFKVVAFCKFCCVRLAKSVCNPVLVYSLNNHSNGWLPIDFNNFSELFIPRTFKSSISKPFFVSYIDGVVHWLVGTACILSFNFHDEVFRGFNIPVVKDDRLPHIAVLNDKLVVYYMNNSYNYGWEVWAMKEYGIEESWTKLHHEVNGLLRFRKGFWKNNADVLFYKLKKLRTILKPSNFKQTRKSFSNLGQVCSYMESLVSVNGYRVLLVE